MTEDRDGGTHSGISGGTQHGPVLQGRDFRDVHIGDVIQAASAPVALAQLPPLETAFTGRDRELAEITALLSPASGAGAVVVSAVAGLAGVGKTTLAVQAAHAAREAGWFPGGVLFIDLHGYDAAPVQPGQALDAFLRALGVPNEQIPAGTAERAGLYRSELAEISDPVLVVADNVSSETQVRPVLPGPGPHRVIVTSRHTLAGLGARLLDVETLSDEDAVALLDAALRAARPGDDRISDDGAGARQLAGACGGLPLALRITAALLVADPAFTAGELAEELADETRRLTALRYDDGGGTSAPSVAAAFELSYQQLDEDAARLFRLLPVNPGPDFSTRAAAALAGNSPRQARTVLGQLIKAHLVEAAAGVGRWRMHDLLRLYAHQLSGEGAGTDEREQAQDRLLDFYARTTGAANEHLRALPGTPVPTDFIGREDALAWLDAERPNLIAAVTIAADISRKDIAMRLPLDLATYLQWRRRLDDWLHVTAISRDAARSLEDKAREAAALGNLGVALRAVGRLEEAITAEQGAASIFQETGDRHREGMALDNLGIVLRLVGRLEEAITVHQDAASIFQETGDRQSEGMALSNLGNALLEEGRFDEAIAAYEQDIAICRETGDRHGEGQTLDNLGIVLRLVGRFDEAIAAHQDAASIFRETGDGDREDRALKNLKAGQAAKKDSYSTN